MRAARPRPVGGSRPPRLAARLATTTLLAALAGWEGVQGRFSTASHVSILAVVAAVVLLALAAGRGRQRERSRAWAAAAVRSLRHGRAAWRTRRATFVGVVGWAVVIAATVGWDAASFVAQEHSLPTLSRVFGALTDHDWGRALVFAAWLALGLYLALGWRLPRPGPQGTRRPLRPPLPRPRATGPPSRAPRTGEETR